LVEPDAIEIRVVGCLIEKQRTTPDAYPLSLNSLRLACNQSTNRDPVVDYDEATVSEALRRLALRGWTRLTSGAGSRARKYRQLMPEALGVDDGELALLGVLMLRGAQTPGELKQRSERLHGFPDLAAVQGALDGLVERGYSARHERRPGQKELRYEQLLGGFAAEATESAPPPQVAPAVEAGVAGPEEEAADESASTRTSGPGPDVGLVPAEDRLTRLERELAELRTELARLREALGEG
jgi:uncharacterized protein YceH (UPF0502 family)